MKKKFYAGIGSRKTPEHILTIMHHVGAYLATQGWILRSGGAEGADSAFENGHRDGVVDPNPEIYVPWHQFNNREGAGIISPREHPFTADENEIAARAHPAWDRCTKNTRLLMKRNVRQIIGMANHANTQPYEMSKFVICWTPNGSGSGGTGQALRIASNLGIPIVDLGHAKTATELEQMVKTIDYLQNQASK